MASITRWDPFSGLTSLHGQLDDMFNNFFSAGWPGIGQNTAAMDIYTEGDKELIAEVHAPGFDKDDIAINVREGVLEIRGEKHAKDEGNDKRNYVRRESYASFARTIALPKTADGDHVKARFDDGVLKVTVPLKELPPPKKVAIESSRK